MACRIKYNHLNLSAVERTPIQNIRDCGSYGPELRNTALSPDIKPSHQKSSTSAKSKHITEGINFDAFHKTEKQTLYHLKKIFIKKLSLPYFQTGSVD